MTTAIIAGLIKLANLAPPDGVSPSLQLFEFTDTTKTLAQLVAANYFDLAYKFLSVGDIILLKGSDGFRHVAIATNTVAAGGHITLSNVGGRLVTGVHAMVAASDTIVTGLGLVTACGATLADNPALTCNTVTATKGDQAGTPAAGSILLKAWKPTGSGDVTPIAITGFGQNVNYWAFGTG